MARAARYPAALLDSVSVERRERFFTKDGGSYVLNKDVRDLCVFSPHSVIRDPPFSKIDLVSCRNLLIYFGVEIQAQVIPTFHYALKPAGFLFLGSAENVSQFEDLFAPVDKHHRIFRRRAVTTPSIPLPVKLGGARTTQSDLPSRRSPLNGVSLRQAVDDQVLLRHAPAHVVVNHDGEVMYFSARTGKYLEVPAGAPTRQLLTLARKELRLDLRAILRGAQESGRMVERQGLTVEMEDGRVQLLSILIEPLGERVGNEALFLVAFVDHGPVLSREDALQRVQNRTSQQTERELRDTRDRLQSLIEEYETSLEELKSANEELVSVNEELQSTNEELEASKEELQSVNEELHTVNGELSGKIEALDRANSDLINLFEATDVATVFLDRQLVIRSFTPAVGKVLNIRSGDLGRPVTDLTSRVSLTGLAAEISEVFRTGRTLERRALSYDEAAHFLIRIAPYVDASKRQEGVVVTFLEVTTLVRAEERQRLLVRELHHRTRNLLGVVQAVASRTLSGDERLCDFDLRLGALSRAQSLITGAVQREIDLGEMIRLELEAVGAPPDRYTLSGPAAKLGFDLIQTLSLALHELTTNALKYGAFASGSGRLEVVWTVEDKGDACLLKLQWQESGVRMAFLSPPKGFGRELIETALVHNHHAKTHMEFTPDGVHCSIEVEYPSRGGLIEDRGQ